jgi:hypothetical protein
VGSAATLADRVELAVARHVASGDPVDEHELQAAVCLAFPGHQTPGEALVRACLASYGLRQDSGLWQARAEDDPMIRREEVKALEKALRRLAERCGFDVSDGPPQTWSAEGVVLYRVVVATYATLGQYMLAAQGPARRRVLVLPGGRAGLAEFKLRRDPRLRVRLRDESWLIVKFRQAWRLANDAEIDAGALEAALAGDPLEAMQQLALLA